MQFSRFDAVIVGHGLAGATLAWTLRLRGQRVLVIDPSRPSTASRIAAGLVTPLSGPKLVPSWGWEQAWPIAQQFYREIEERTGIPLLRPRPAVRLFPSSEALQQAKGRVDELQGDLLPTAPDPGVNPNWFSHAEHAIEQPAAAQLDVSEYLNASRQLLKAEQCWIDGEFESGHDLILEQERVTLPRWNVETNRVVFCQGYVADHPWFGRVKFNPAQGQMLTIRAPELRERRVVHDGLWLVQENESRHYRVGATFEWDRLDGVPTEKGREHLLQRLRQMIRVPFEVIDQFAAVRPTMHDFRPVIGTHPTEPRFAILNGLGTKGSLWGPWMAKLLADHLLDAQPIPSELEVARWFR